jgi:isopentenyl-diphosphate Delta-isomerase
VKANPDEIMETKYVTEEELGEDMSRHPERYTPWFKIAFERYGKLGH